MSNFAQLPDHLKERYGVNKRDWSKIVATAILLACGIGLVLFTGYRNSRPSVAGELISFKVISADKVTVTWKVQRPEESLIYCVIRAQDVEKTDVGYATVSVPAGAKYSKFSYDLTTNGEAVLAEVLGCGSTKKFRVPPPNFPPGVQIPAQLPPGIAPERN